MYGPCLLQWRCAWIASFTCWINFTIYMRRIDGFGIYVIMFTAVLGSVFKILVLIFFFLFAFGSAFYIVMGKLDIWEHMYTNIVTALVMTIGEIDYFDQFVDIDLTPFVLDAHILLMFFVILMPIIMINLLIGVAIGDISSIQKNSYVTRLKLQMYVIKDMENAFPRMIQRKLYMGGYTVKPNANGGSYWGKIKEYFGSPTAINFLLEEEPKEELATQTDIHKLKARLQHILTLMDHQSELMQKMAQHMQLESKPVPLDALSHSSEF
ncbi:transient receptor potential cation channel subfamily A member 1-like [Lineus longissimus]|uniref:transient receptor potential cation channel subfamily A member 1-like n=1 Tax=Lineus longissimus TaxID=88925 RepID=UPI002B4EDE22